MLFNSYAFIFGYLPITLIGFFWLGRTSHRMAALWLANSLAHDAAQPIELKITFTQQNWIKV